MHTLLMIIFLLGSMRVNNEKIGFNPVQENCKIVVEIGNLPSNEGNLRIAVFNKAEGFRDEKYAIQKKPFKIVPNERTYSFENLVPGKYAIAVYHDRNNNGKLDTNFMGIPTEAYGFSNDVMGWFGPPEFEAASFDTKPGTNLIKIKLR